MLRRGAAAAAVVAAIAAVSSSGCSDDTPERAAPPRETPRAPSVIGPLCDLLPSDDDPGAPASLTDEPADVALTWIARIHVIDRVLR